MAIAVVFAGQGAQYSGMGKDLYENSAAARMIFDTADSVRDDISKLCFDGTAEELSQTINTQPAMLAMDLACAESLREAGIVADCTAGFSLGEIAALTYAGAINLSDSFKLICKRAEFMAESTEGSMVAVLKLSNADVEQLAQQHGVYPVNYNCPGQISVAGAIYKLESFSQAVSESGGRSIKLAVSGAFHSPYMQGASARLSEVLDTLKIALQTDGIPVYSNVTAKPYTNDVRSLLSKQVMSPVLWQQTIENMIADGINTFIEVGPGKVLSGLIKRISKDVAVFNVEKYTDIEMVNKNVKK